MVKTQHAIIIYLDWFNRSSVVTQVCVQKQYETLLYCPYIAAPDPNFEGKKWKKLLTVQIGIWQRQQYKTYFYIFISATHLLCERCKCFEACFDVKEHY